MLFVKIMRETKEIILETAYQMFLSNNYEAVTISNIIKATGLTKGAIYHYYESKEELFKAVVDTYLVKEHHDYSVPLGTASFKELIDKYLEGKKEHYAKAVELHQVISSGTSSENLLIQHLSLVVSASRYHTGYTQKAKAFFAENLKQWVYAIKIGVKTGELKSDIDPELAAMNFIFLEATVAFSTMLKGDDLDNSFDLYERQMNEMYKNIKA